LLGIGCAFLPVVVVVLLVWYYFDRGLLAYTPTWSDEVNYWREIYTFRHVGFDGGYYTLDELPARAAFSHFGAHGPAFAMLFGFIAVVTGWGAVYGPVLNLACLGLAMLAYFWMARLDRWQLLLATLSILVFWPILLYIPTTMQETVQQALAVALAGVFYLLIKNRDQVGAGVYLLGLVLLLVAASLRPTWSPLFVALFLFRTTAISRRRVLLSTLLAAPLVIALFAVYTWLSSPYPNNLSQMFEAAGRSGRQGVMLFLHHFKHNVYLLWHGQLLERGLRLQLFAILVIAIGCLAYRGYRNRKIAGDLDGLCLFHLVNLGSILLIVLAAYDIAEWRDFRVFAPHVLLSILVSVPFARRAFVVVPLVANLLVVVAFASAFRVFHADHFSPEEARRPSLIAQAIRYEPGGDPWRNTLLVDTGYGSELLQLPAGIGVSLMLAPQSHQKPIKSRYLLVTDDTLKLMGNPPGLRLLGTTPRGKLYIREG
jgi:hypothetical protein